MELLSRINEIIGNAVWGIPAMALLIGAGVYLSVTTGFVQLRRFGYAMRSTIGRIFKKQAAAKGEMTPFQAMTTALAATAGTGNIAGISSAITLGGPGAIFWMWVSALFGMCTKYAEVTLAVKFRERNKKGEWVGGPMYYIEKGLGKSWRWLSFAFCIFGALAAFGIGNAVQVGNITSSVGTAILAFSPASADKLPSVSLFLGIALAVVCGITLLGGVKRLGRATELLVPFMSIVYIAGCLIVIGVHFENVGSAFASIFREAFTPTAAMGGAAGITVKTALSFGLKRGVFSNEAGLGSAPIAHASSSERDAVKQGMFGIFEVFIDTIVMCTITALTILASGIHIDYASTGTVAMNISAFATVFGEKVSAVLFAVITTLFALATVLGWSLYGSRCAEYILGERSVKPYLVIYILVIIVGATMDLGLAWDISDTLNGLMAIPNIIAILGLSAVVARMTRQHFGQNRRRE